MNENISDHVGTDEQDDYAAYQLLGDDATGQRWAFGTGFTDPLAGVDTSVPPGIDGAALGAYCLMLGDDALIYSHRLQQWITRAPELEEETALANIALDLLGQARMLLARAGIAVGRGHSEDDLAFRRESAEFTNVLLAEIEDHDFAELVMRLLVLSTWRLALFDGLRTGADPVLAAIAGKAVTEITYHRDYAAQWVIRLGDGTDLSRARITAAIGVVVPFLDELFTAHPVQASLPGVATADPALRAEVMDVLGEVLHSATLGRALLDLPTRPAAPVLLSGRDGQHTPAMREILDELQGVARSLPGAQW